MSRREFSDKVKLQAFLRCKGNCEIPSCGAFLRPGKYTFDHVIPDQMGGDPTLENCQVICRECDRDKTARDMTDIAKAKRRQRKNFGIKGERKIRAWRNFKGEVVFAPKER